MITNNFAERHLGPSPIDVEKMLQHIGVSTLDELIDQTIPSGIRLKDPLHIDQGMNEYEVFQHLKTLGQKNKLFRSFIGMGYYNTILPGVIQRNILENPGWYTSYTPYQAEISQGRLEALLNFQTMVVDLTGLPISNSSLLDEATAAAEAMIMTFNCRSRTKIKTNANKFFVSQNLFPQTIALLQTRSAPLGIELMIGNHDEIQIDDGFFGGIVQYPDGFGQINNYRTFTEKMHSMEALVVVAADILSLVLLTPPGEWGADIVVGSTQRFGIPMSYGGPHAAFLASKEEFKRSIPGRIIGISVDAQGHPGLRMALQTREQHIKREKATSNICTAQALLAIMAGMYAVYHGPKGLHKIARHINILTGVLASEASKYGYIQLNSAFFDTIRLSLPEQVNIETIKNLALERQFNLRYIDHKTLGISLDETTSLKEINQLLEILAKAANQTFHEFICNPAECENITTFPSEFVRQSAYLTHPVFNSYHSETSMMRYLKKLENRDLALNRTMIPLGSCTMKLTAGVEMFPLSWPEFNSLHPFVPADQAEGYHLMINELESLLKEITGFSAFTFQPNSGANGEYTGLMIIRKYHESRGEGHRNVCLIPSSAHGTNPASAHFAGMEVVVVKCDENGNVDITDLREKATQYKDHLAALMITYPSTHGVFEEGILEIVHIIHQNGGQVYMDGANMNAQVGLTSPGRIGADVCHLNLHKTFAIPHGGGGPGVGPVGVAKHLVPFLPQHPVVKTGGQQGISAVAAAPYGSALVLTISYAYMKLLGRDGLTNASKYAILNANYLKARLENHYKILYTGKNGRVAHEMILDCNKFQLSANVSVIDIAKRLIDYGFHAPTVAFPVHGTLMVEPTESEPLEELDRIVDALIGIREEIASIENLQADRQNNLLKNAPHTAAMVVNSQWNYPYSREKAAFPLSGMETDKYFPPVGRIDDAYGDRNLVCTCQTFDF
ncbi:MAG TPA: aminomethyl-transferring glycine dehydrogenase [Bacteroidales bacterium]|nr:aminomethyl-transferring glycine dehydrogenase [Bacteroidales bacterium]